MKPLAKQSRRVYSLDMKIAKHIYSQTDLLEAFRAVYSVKGRNGRLTDGKREMAKCFGVSHQYVCNWFARPADGGEPSGVPNGYHYRVHLWCVRHGYLLHPEVFGLGHDSKPLSQAESAAA
jgi:hypothetical protein